MEAPRGYRDYDASVRLDAVPRGVQMGFLSAPGGEICWDQLPESEDWFVRG